jgi:hypothetical protein
MERISKVPNRLTSKNAIDKDDFVSIGLSTTTKPILEYDLVNVVNQQELYENERRKVRKYRFSGRLNTYTANELTPTTKIENPDGTTTVITGALNEDWDPLFDGDPQLTPNNWLLQILYPFKKEYEYIIKYDNGDPSNPLVIQTKAELGPQIKKLSLATPSGSEEKVLINGVQKHGLKQDDFIYINDTNIITNPYNGVHRVISIGNEGQNMDTDFVIDTPYVGDYLTPSNYRRIYNPSQNDINYANAIEIYSITATDYNGGTIGQFNPGDIIYSRIQTQTPHNLVITTGTTVNPIIDIRGVGILNGLFEVVSVIDEFLFTIKLTFFTVKGQSQIFTQPRPTFRILDGTPSEYYVRKFKVLTTNDYDVYDCAFSSSIYPETVVNELGISNKTWLYHFNKDVDVETLLDHNNKPLTELYLGFIKRAGQNTFPWSKVTSGWDFNRSIINTTNGLETISNYVNNGVGTIEKPSNLFDYVGDFAEYNRAEIKERVVSKIVHRFGKVSDPNGEGYFLEPFKKLQIMVFSDIIETSSINEPTEGIPNYAETYPNGVIAWKDLLDIGYIEPENENGVDYPFVNGVHYFYGNYNFYIRRQRPIPEKVLDQGLIKISEIQDVC